MPRFHTHTSPEIGKGWRRVHERVCPRFGVQRGRAGGMRCASLLLWGGSHLKTGLGIIEQYA